MDKVAHAYAPPNSITTSAPPLEVARYLDGSDLLTKTQALRLSTVDAEGWPHASLLSVGDMLVTPSGRIRFALFPQSATTANLARDGRLTITLTLGGRMCELRAHAHPIKHSSPDVPLAFFEATVQSARTHFAPYAALTSGVTFALHEPEEVLLRWRRQIEALRAAV